MGEPRIAEIQGVIAHEFGLTMLELKGSCRKRHYSRPRQIAMALCRGMTSKSYPQIGNAFGDKDHTTCLYAYRKIKRLEAEDQNYAKLLDELREKIVAVVRLRGGALGCSTEWSPPPPMQVSKPTRIKASIRADLGAWTSLGGELEAVA